MANDIWVIFHPGNIVQSDGLHTVLKHGVIQEIPWGMSGIELKPNGRCLIISLAFYQAEMSRVASVHGLDLLK